MSSIEGLQVASYNNYRIVWRFAYEYQARLAHCEANEVVTDGWEPGHIEYFDVIAATPELARAAWQKENGHRAITADMPMEQRAAIEKGMGHFTIKLLSGPDALCLLDKEILIR